MSMKYSLKGIYKFLSNEFHQPLIRLTKRAFSIFSTVTQLFKTSTNQHQESWVSILIPKHQHPTEYCFTLTSLETPFKKPTISCSK